ncbi:MAG: glycosyltransferase family 2 protein [Planctomycetaceae bacterium]
MVEVSILIVCYKSKDLIEACLEGVFAHTQGVDFEVLLLDCSNDGTVDLVAGRFPKVRIVENDENLGFARGNNVLATHALGKYLLLLNPDTVVETNAIGELYRTAVRHPEAGAVGGRARRADGSRDPGCRQAVPSLSRLVVAALGGAKLLNGALAEDAVTPDEVETLSGAFMMVRADVWREHGGFDTSFFMYAEELDLCYRLRRAGYAVMMTPAAEIVHLVGGGNAMNPSRILNISKARMHFFRKFWTSRQVVLAGLILWLHGAIRFAAGWAGDRLLRWNRGKQLQAAYADVVLTPSSWWQGFSRGDAS